jgi:hypothetical protein
MLMPAPVKVRVKAREKAKVRAKARVKARARVKVREKAKARASSPWDVICPAECLKTRPLARDTCMGRGPSSFGPVVEKLATKRVNMLLIIIIN